MRKLLLIIFILMSSHVFSQQSESGNKIHFSKNTLSIDGSSIYLVAFAGYGAGVNYERLLYDGSRNLLYGRLGVGFSVYGDASPRAPVGVQIPASISLISGGRSNHFEMNFGLRTVLGGNFVNTSYFYPIINFGYRYQRPEGGFIWKILGGTDGITLGLGVGF